MVAVVSEPEADTIPAVRLTYSRFFLSGNPFRIIKNADVKLAVNATQYTGTFSDSAYVFPCILREGDSLMLTVRMQNGGEDTVVTASTRVPYRPNVTVKETIGTSFHFTVNDCAGESNFYRMSFKVIDTAYYYFDSEGNYVDADDPAVVQCDTVVESWWSMFGCSDAALTSNASSTIDISIDGEELFGELLFTDELFDGQNRDITVKLSSYNEQYSYEKSVKRKASKQSPNQVYVLYLESLSKETYLYELSRYKQNNEDVFMTEPVQIQSNIKNGIGIFGAKATRVVTLGTQSTTDN